MKDPFSTPLTPQRAAAWEKIRSKGKYHFMFVRGAAGAGGLLIVLMTLFHAFIVPGHFTWGDFITSLFLYPIVGTFWGMFMWNHFDARYRSYQSRCELEQLEASHSTPISKL